MQTKKIQPQIQVDWMRCYAVGLSFADVGGLWGTVGEKVSAAHKAGAGKVTMVDVMPLHSDWWERFLDHAQRHGAPRSVINCVVADLERDNFAKNAGKFDYINCSGVLYHVPNPLGVLRNLYRATTRYLSVATQILPERIETEKGTLVIPPGQGLFIPSLTREQREILAAYYDQHNYKVTHVNRDGPPYFEKGKFNYGPSYWLPTLDQLLAMLRLFGLEIVDTAFISDHGAAVLTRRAPDADVQQPIAGTGITA